MPIDPNNKPTIVKVCKSSSRTITLTDAPSLGKDLNSSTHAYSVRDTHYTPKFAYM